MMLRYFGLFFALCLTAAGYSQDFQPYPGADCRVRTLPNGLTLVVCRDPRLSYGHVLLQTRAGTVFDPPEQRGLAALALHMLSGPPKPGGKDLLWTSLDQGVEFTFYWYRGEVRFAASMLPQRLDSFLTLLAQRLLQPVLNDGVLEIERQNALERFARAGMVKGKSAMVNDLLEQSLPNSPWAVSWHGDKQGLERITMDSVKRFIAQHYQAANSALYVTGPWEISRVESSVAAGLGRWSPGGKAVPWPPMPEFRAVRLDAPEESHRNVRVAAFYRSPSLVIVPGSLDSVLLDACFGLREGVVGRKMGRELGYLTWMDVKAVAAGFGVLFFELGLTSSGAVEAFRRDIGAVPDWLEGQDPGGWSGFLEREWQLERESVLQPYQLNRRMASAWLGGGLEAYLNYLKSPTPYPRAEIVKRARELFDPKKLSSAWRSDS